MNVYPPIDYDALKWLQDFIEDDMIVFEYGSGSSTLYFRETVKAVVSVEHSPDKYNKLKKRMRWYNNNSTYELIEPVDEPKPYPYSHENYGSIIPSLLYKNFKSYVNYIDIYIDNSFDIIFINGRSRASCIRAAVPKVRKGGIIIVNNSDRYEYQDAMNLFLGKFPVKHFGLKEIKTAIYEIK